MNMPSTRSVNDFFESASNTTKELLKRVADIVEQVKNRKYSIDELMNAGFEYANDGKTIKCTRCGVEVMENNEKIDLYRYHYEHNVDCPFVRSIEVKKRLTNHDLEQGTKRQKTECRWSTQLLKNRYLESKLLQDARIRTFSHWRKNVKPIKAQMIAAGFFQCNVGDRVICLYCNLIAQQWKEDDDPLEVHSTLSPNCCYVQTVVNFEESPSIRIVNDSIAQNNTTDTNDNLLRFDQIVYTSAIHPRYSTITSREATFETWNTELLPAVNDLVQAGFFHNKSGTITTCFYCGGSLQNWRKNDKPIVEHVRFFSTCKYARQVVGDELFEKIEEAKRARAAREAAIAQSNNSVNRQLNIPDEQMLSRLVAARLDLPVSQRLLDNPFKLSIIKRCWEDQLRLKRDDFETDTDLYVACQILQKQVEIIDGNKDNIVIPSVKMREIRDGVITEILSNELVTTENQTSTLEPMIVENNIPKEDTKTDTVVENPCVLCWKEEKRLACIPCGHLVACLSCQKTLRTCPICCRRAEAFVRVYI